ncbi:unnamed protein product [Sordaria macrospora k-hell]|uniref:WGS project CABT00000000 data, contig 2.21 n=1 Tax=Sordaria macrospora (strain ATCC MYA-333 / DSM 997 / K(L3346) / K-hell) TaxID=771870 RepID=F7W241_SORMK|nr:uncharacterized protein SMAC_04674 [Sordaria macrospora k-hell]CCC11691.1 unnamed protein product [Sordaria macrospora k-hell]
MDASQLDSQPLFYSPALPSELLWYIIHRCSYPTTLIVCSSRLEFLTALARDIKGGQQGEEEQESRGQRREWQERQQSLHQVSEQGTTSSKDEEAQEAPIQGQHPPTQPRSPSRNNCPNTTSSKINTSTGPGSWTSSQFLASPLYQLAVARHIRTVFIPTVSHLRAFLSVFDTNTTSSANNNNNNNKQQQQQQQHWTATSLDNNNNNNKKAPSVTKRQIIVYGLLSLHRDSSEWSVQGLNNTLSVLLEAGRRVRLGVGVVEPVEYDDQKSDLRRRSMDDLLGDKMPVVSRSALRGAAGAGDLLLERSVAGKTVDVRRVLGRWFRFGIGEWGMERERERGYLRS